MAESQAKFNRKLSNTDEMEFERRLARIGLALLQPQMQNKNMVRKSVYGRLSVTSRSV